MSAFFEEFKRGMKRDCPSRQKILSVQLCSRGLSVTVVSSGMLPKTSQGYRGLACCPCCVTEEGEWGLHSLGHVTGHCFPGLGSVRSDYCMTCAF